MQAMAHKEAGTKDQLNEKAFTLRKDDLGLRPVRGHPGSLGKFYGTGRNPASDNHNDRL